MTTEITSLRLEYGSATPFVGVERPRISWKTATDVPDWEQASAELSWTTDGVESFATVAGRESVLVAWPFAALSPRRSGVLRVRTTGTDGARSVWSDPVAVTGGMLAPGEWRAAFIGLAAPERPAHPLLVRREFEVDGDVRAATLYATAEGVYQLEVNGRGVDDQVLKPGWTSYQYRLIHETTDVTRHVRRGRNALGAAVAGGWFTERYGFQGNARTFYGEQPAVAAQLVVEYVDGRVQTVVTGPDWSATGDGEIVTSGIYVGEHVDARRREAGWSAPGFDDSAWQPVSVHEGSVEPEARSGPVARRIEELAVREVLTSPSGATLLDFGQNVVGRLRITVSGEAGQEIVLRHAEVLEFGELGTRPLRLADATDRYVLAGAGVETWEPAFTFHGFRYVQVDGWPGELDPADIVAVVVHSDMERTGWFRSSDPLLDRFHENVVWGMRGNFLYLPTDCPQRDERLGWTGDIQVFAPAATYLFDAGGLLASWLRDLLLEQRGGAGVPFVVPDVLGSAAMPAAAWGDAATVVPSVLYERYADRGVLEAQLDSMRGWVDQVLEIAGGRHLWEGRFQFGDWLDPDAPSDRPAHAKTDADIVASAYLYRSTRLLAEAAGVLGRHELADRYAAEAEVVRRAWLDEYVTPAGRIVSDAQTAYALAIMFDLETDPIRLEMMGDRLAGLVRRDGYRIGTGFVGTPLVTDALTRTRHDDAASRLLLQTENPSWLYPVTMGATTVWERWDSMLEDGTINPGEMTSFNHYALGAIADWLHRRVAGLAPAEPGYRRIRVAPVPLRGLDHAETEHETPFGRARVAWSADAGQITVSATVPPNTRAEVLLPGRSETFEVGSGQHRWTLDDSRDDHRTVELGLHSSLAAIVEDREAYETVVAVLDAADPEWSRTFRRHTQWVEERRLSEAFLLGAPNLESRVESALDELNGRRRR
ncbi:alpha-L-rhamnosidase [Cellulomonas humilata]|uniref:alpha-L-rhamnosidase n=1 Tax=Cellulomonas humilata TaxID=144055 RepID=A0ABU0EDQ5_9CELL|nr:alpha-L-rhamnosidase [Cellulomonas humilata]MDQ0373392.1 alpha-L-rhamnosidase [Cellulomonas humilata]